MLGKYDADYLACPSCELLRANNPTWLDEAYSDAIAIADTGLVARNVSLAEKIAVVLYWVSASRGRARYVDLAGGYGMFTRLMRDRGFDFYWSDKYSANLLARGFEHNARDGNCEAVTAIEVFEHLEKPLDFIQDALSETSARMIVFTTELYDGSNPPAPGAWPYYAFETGQHISFYSRRTLETLASTVGSHFATARGVHVISKDPIQDARLDLMLSKLGRKLSSRLIRRNLKSKTFSDHQLLLRGHSGARKC